MKSRISSLFSRTPVLVASISVSIVVVGILLFIKQKANSFFLGDPTLIMREKDMRLGGKSCIYRLSKTGFPACEEKYGAVVSQSKKLFIVGDSHALRLAPFARLLASSIDAKISITAVPGSPFPPLRVVKDGNVGGSKRGYFRQKVVLNTLLNSLSEGDVVVIVNSGSYFSSEFGSELRFPGRDWLGSRRSYLFSDLKDQLEVLIRRADLIGARVVYVLPSPHFGKTDRELCFRQWFQWGPENKDCSKVIMRQSVVQRFHSDLLRALPGSSDKNSFYVFDPLNDLCSARKCGRLVNGRQMYVDGSHLSYEGSQALSKGFYKFWLSNGLSSRY